MKGSPRPAQYLLRIDDLCATVHRDRWRRLLEVVREFGISPILAIVPENRDPELAVSPPDPEFWDTMRHMQSQGAAIGLHGYRHVCTRGGRGFLPLSRSGEFAGVPLATQQERIRRGRDILRREELDAKLWVAPRHSFDANTLRALRAEGMLYVSDGMMRGLRWRGGMVWIPQQLWGPARKESGLWTICVHPNSLDARGLQRLRGFLSEHGAEFTSFPEVVSEWRVDAATWVEGIRERTAVERIRLRRVVRGAVRSTRSGAGRGNGQGDRGIELPIDPESSTG